LLTKTFDIDLNTLHGGHKNTDISVNQGDTNSVVFNFRVFKGSNEIDYTLVESALLFVERPGGGGSGVQQVANIKSGGGFTITLSQQLMSSPGPAIGGLVLYGNNDERVVTLFFMFHVERDVFGEIVEGSVEFDALQRAIQLLKDTIALYEKWSSVDINMLAATVEVGDTSPTPVVRPAIALF